MALLNDGMNSPPNPHSGGLSDFQSPSLVGDLGGVSEMLLPTDSYLDSATPF